MLFGNWGRGVFFFALEKALEIRISSSEREQI